MIGDLASRPPASGMAPALAAQRQLDATVRAEYGRVLSVLLKELRDFDLAEDALGDALADAAEQWPTWGAPDHPGGLVADGGASSATTRQSSPICAAASRKSARPAPEPTVPGAILATHRTPAFHDSGNMRRLDPVHGSRGSRQ